MLIAERNVKSPYHGKEKEVSCAFSHAFENVDNGILWEGAVCLLKGNSHQIISVASMIELHLEHFFSVLLAYIRSQKAG